MEKARVLILSSSTGGGHDMRAQAFRAWASKTASSWDVRQHQALESAHGFYRFGVEFYNCIQRHAPFFHHFYFNELEILSLFKNPDRIMGRQQYQVLLKEFQPHAVLSVHGSTNHGFFDLTRQTLGSNNVRCVTYCGELFGGYGLSRHWINPEADLFIGAVPETCDAAASHGMPSHANRLGGFLLRPEFYQETLSVQQILEGPATELNLNPEQLTLLLSTGANGANNHPGFLRALARQVSEPLQVIALCGKDDQTRAHIEASQKLWPHFQVRALGRREDMAALMQLAHVMVARPGTGTVSEAIQLGCPLILNGLGGVMPQEWITVKFCRKHGLADVIYTSNQLARRVKYLLAQPADLIEVREKMKKVRPTLHPTGILQMVLG